MAVAVAQLLPMLARSESGCACAVATEVASAQGSARSRKDETWFALSARAEAFRREDVAAFAVRVLDQRDMRAAVRIVLEALYNTWNTVLVPLEIDDAITLLVTTATMTHRDAAIVVAATFRRFLVDQRTMRLALVKAVGLYFDDEAASSRCRFSFMK